MSSNFLSPVTQHHPCNHTCDVCFSARCLSNTSKLTWHHLHSPWLQWKWLYNMWWQLSVCELWMWEWLSELPAPTRTGLCLRPVYLAVFPNWLKKSVQKKYCHDRQESWTLHHICETQLGFLVEYLVGWITPSAIWYPWVPEARKVLPCLKAWYVSMYVCGSSEKHMFFQQCSPKAWCLWKAEAGIMLL